MLRLYSSDDIIDTFCRLIRESCTFPAWFSMHSNWGNCQNAVIKTTLRHNGWDRHTNSRNLSLCFIIGLLGWHLAPLSLHRILANYPFSGLWLVHLSLKGTIQKATRHYLQQKSNVSPFDRSGTQMGFRCSFLGVERDCSSLRWRGYQASSLNCVKGYTYRDGAIAEHCADFDSVRACQARQTTWRQCKIINMEPGRSNWTRTSWKTHKRRRRTQKVNRVAQTCWCRHRSHN